MRDYAVVEKQKMGNAVFAARSVGEIFVRIKRALSVRITTTTMTVT